MRKLDLLFFISFFLSLTISKAQYPEGNVKTEYLYSEVLENEFGENPNRRVTIYLPPEYSESKQRYPVLYFLHGFTWSDSLMIAESQFDKLLDKAIAKDIIEPVIVVMPNHFTLFRGSWYTNSKLTGKWADFTGEDLVNFVDHNYRTISNRDYRGIAGHSMGGQGAIKIAMLFSDIFSTVYALSPATLDPTISEFGIQGEAYKRINEISTREELITDWNEFLPNAIVAMGRAFSPNLNKPPFYADFPYEYVNDSLIVNYEVLELWKKKSAMGMVDHHIEDLRKLNAIKLDWGRNDGFDHIPTTCLLFSKKLENLGINHFAEEYIGNHSNKLFTDDGRVMNDMLPFFNTYLKFEE